MKLKLLFILLLIIQLLKAQKQVEYVSTFYQSDGTVRKEISKMIELKQENVDLKTLNSSFSLFRFIPDNFIDNALTDTTILVTRDGDIYEKFDITHPLEIEFYYLVFDSLSRIIKYGYSGCGVCSHLPYYWDISYNKYMKVNKMTMVMFGKETSNINIDYNNMGDIVLFESYNNEKELRNKISIK